MLPCKLSILLLLISGSAVRSLPVKEDEWPAEDDLVQEDYDDADDEEESKSTVNRDSLNIPVEGNNIFGGSGHRPGTGAVEITTKSPGGSAGPSGDQSGGMGSSAGPTPPGGMMDSGGMAGPTPPGGMMGSGGMAGPTPPGGMMMGGGGMGGGGMAGPTPPGGMMGSGGMAGPTPPGGMMDPSMMGSQTGGMGGPSSSAGAGFNAMTDSSQAFTGSLPKPPKVPKPPKGDHKGKGGKHGKGKGKHGKGKGKGGPKGSKGGSKKGGSPFV